jgi:hypothetical protein
MIQLPHGTFAEDILKNLVTAAGFDYREWIKDTIEEVERAQKAIKATHASFDPNDVAVSITLSRIHRMLNRVPR